jgi:hypothetical protein
MDLTDGTRLLETTSAGHGSEGCVLVVFSYDDVADVVEPVVTDAATQILAAPALGDFVQLRFARGGARPRTDAPPEGQLPSQVEGQVMRALVRSEPPAEKTYFALAAVDQSAGQAMRMLAGCRSDPVLGPLSPRCAGFAVVDDQPSDIGAAQMIIAPSGEWTGDTLAAEFVRLAGLLFAHYAASHDAGLTREQFAELKKRCEADDRSGETGAAGSGAGLDLSPAVPDDKQPETGAADQGSAAQGGAADQDLGRAVASPPIRRSPERWRPWRRGDGDSADTAEPVADASAKGAPAPDGAAAGAELEGVPVPPLAVPRPLASAYLYLLLHDEQHQHGRSAWRRRRGQLLELDLQIAAALPGQVRLRVFSGREGTTMSSLVTAGQLSGRDLKAPDPGSELAPALDRVRTWLDRDLAAASEVRPMIVIVTPEIPVADAITVQAFARAAACAPVSWMLGELPVPEVPVSTAFTASGTQILADDEAVGAQLVELITTRAAKTGPGDADQPAQGPEVAAGS